MHKRRAPRRRNSASTFAHKLHFEQLEDRRMLAVFSVTNFNDAGAGSLRAAIAEANAAPGSDVIEFDAATVGTINLTSGQLTITDSLVINGPGAEVLTIDANELSRVFKIDDGRDETRIDVRFVGLSITGGLVAADDTFVRVAGGGVFSRENLTIIDSSIVNNSAVPEESRSPAPFGGGIFVVDADLTLVRSVVSGNSSGLYRDRDVRESFGGGVVHWREGILTVSDSTISGNTANTDGGGILVGGSRHAIISNSTISDNVVGERGGGIFADHAEVTIVESTVSGNVAGNGGGINSYFSEMTITDSTITGNSVAGDHRGGGGIASVGGNLTVVSSEVSENKVDGRDSHSAGIFSSSGNSSARPVDDGRLTIIGSTISGNTASGESASGGGISVYRGTVDIENSTITGNIADDDGGAIFIFPRFVAVTVTNSTISGNTARNSGGIFAVSSDVAVTLNGSILSGNTLDGQVAGDIAGSIFLAANHSLIGVAASGQLDAGSDNIINDDPRLGPLADNGGRTKTHVLLPGSPAIDAGDPELESPPQFDQRGAPFPRVVNGRIDIGAYEFQPPPTSPAPLVLEALSPTEVRVSWTDSQHEIGYRLYQWVQDKGVEIARFEPDETSHLVSGLQRGTTYSFSVEAFNTVQRVFVGWDEVSTPLDVDVADLTGNGFVDFEDLTVLLANWNQNVSAVEGNLVDADGSPVNFEDLTLLLSAWTGPNPAGAPGAAVVGGDSVGDPANAGALIAVGDASYRRGGEATGGASYRLRRGAPRSRPESGIYRRLQAVAVDRAMREEQIFEPTQRTFARRTRP